MTLARLLRTISRPSLNDASREDQPAAGAVHELRAHARPEVAATADRLGARRACAAAGPTHGLQPLSCGKGE